MCGDTLLLLQARLIRRPLRQWMTTRPIGVRVERASHTINRNAATAIIAGRLLPGGRAPMIISLALAGLPVKRFIPYNAIACAAWAAIYTTIGAIGSSLGNSPITGVIIAISTAALAGGIVQLVRRIHHTTPAHPQDGVPMTQTGHSRLRRHLAYCPRQRRHSHRQETRSFAALRHRHGLPDTGLRHLDHPPTQGSSTNPHGQNPEVNPHE